MDPDAKTQTKIIFIRPAGIQLHPTKKNNGLPTIPTWTLRDTTYQYTVKRVKWVWGLYGWVQKWRNWTQFSRRQYRSDHQMYIFLELTQLGLTRLASWPITIPYFQNSFRFWGKQQTFPFFSVSPKKLPFFLRVLKHLVKEESWSIIWWVEYLFRSEYKIITKKVIREQRQRLHIPRSRIFGHQRTK